MELKLTTYSVLIASASDKFSSAITGMLPESRYRPVKFASSVSEARRELLERDYDVVIINAPLPDEFGTRFAVDLTKSGGAGVLLLVSSEHFSEIANKLGEYGVFVLPRPTSPSLVTQALTLACATRERMKRVELKAQTMEEKMDEIRLVNRAKWILIDQLKMSEPDAHRYIEKTAMDRCTTKRVVAQSIIRTYG